MAENIAAFRITVSAASEDAALAAFWERGTLGAQVEPAPDGRIVLLAYFLEEEGLIEALRMDLRPLGASLEPISLPEVDWVARFRDGFRSLRVGSFQIAPPWDVPAPADEHVLVLDPGRAFGTGTHESTRLCLLALESLAAERPLGRVLDVGTGTGILALAAQRLGARRVVAIDLDADAVESARRHAWLNRAPILLLRGNAGRPFRPSSFDVVLANLSAPALIERSDELAGRLTPGGALVAAGFLEEDLATVTSAFAGLARVATRTEAGWAALTLTRPSA